MTSLVPVTRAVARAVVDHGDLDAALGRPRRADWPTADTADALRPLAEHGGHAFLVCVDDEVVGECGWLGPPDAGGAVDVHVGLCRSGRGRGHAAAALAELLVWVRRQGARSARAEVRPGNAPSLRLCTGLGFVPVEQRAGFVVLVRSLP